MAQCHHGKRKYFCVDCGGGGICEHGRQKHTCKECGGSSVCEHGRIRATCKDCGGSRICEHGRQRPTCKDCGGSQICEHGRIRATCKDCGGSRICEHGRERSTCKDCGGSQICEHGRQRRDCKECGGTRICEHNRHRAMCKDCGGSQICKHNKQKAVCKECGGSSLCKSEWCTTVANRKYNGYCMRCCVHLFPDIPVSRNYKTKENEVVSRVKETFPGLTWVHDKRIADGCSTRRPDLLVDLGSHVLVIEVRRFPFQRRKTSSTLAAGGRTQAHGVRHVLRKQEAHADFARCGTPTPRVHSLQPRRVRGSGWRESPFVLDLHETGSRDGSFDQTKGVGRADPASCRHHSTLVREHD